jgi:hypothetical protein
MAARAALSQLLIVGGLLLMVAIGVGIGMGNRVLGQVTGREPVIPTPVPIPTPSAGDHESWATSKRTSVMAVATDPAFPDPRVTPEPEVKATARPTPTPKATQTPAKPAEAKRGGYTSPPLPLPLVSHTPEGPGADSEPTRLPGPQPIVRLPPAASRPPSRIPVRFPTLPPVAVPSLSP